MLIKQLQVMQLDRAINLSANKLQEVLEPLAFQACLPSFASSMGWVPIIDDEFNDSLFRIMQGNIMLCLQSEEKILPGSVVKQELLKKIARIQTEEDRKVWRKEKLAMKEEVILSLLPKAFSRLSKTIAYIDTQKNWLVLGTTNAKKTEQFLGIFKKSFDVKIEPLAVHLQKLSPIFTQWVKQQNYPDSFAVEKQGVLQDPQQKNRVIRCQQQSLFAPAIQTLLTEGCDIKQISLTWQDRLSFSLGDDFMLRTIKFQDELIAAAREIEQESKLQQFETDCFLMIDNFNKLLVDLVELFQEVKQSTPRPANLALVT